MKTPSTHQPLTAAQRAHLRAQIDQAVRARIGQPTEPCPECGADTRLIAAPVYGCTTCANRFWRRRQRRH
jgi:hypothetical protein